MRLGDNLSDEEREKLEQHMKDERRKGTKYGSKVESDE